MKVEELAIVPFKAKKVGTKNKKQNKNKNKNKNKKNTINNSSFVSVKERSAPIATSAIITTPKKTNSKSTFSRLEEIATITGTTTAFALTNNLSLNPGLSATFPWLSSPASAFNIYKVRKLRVWYLNATNTTNTGLVVVGYNPDPNDPPPTSLAQIENYESRLRVATWEDSYFDVPKSDLDRINKYFVRGSIVPGELSTYDIGALYVVCSGNASSSATLGELWFEYTIDLMSPIVSTGVQPIGKASSTYTPVAQALTSTVTTIVTFPTVVDNALALVNNAGTFTGITGALLIYAQVSIAATTMTVGSLAIQKNGASVIAVSFPPIITSLTTANVFSYVSLLPSDTFNVVVTVTGTGLTADSGNALSGQLIITAA